MAGTHIHALINAIVWYGLFLSGLIFSTEIGIISREPIYGLFFILGGIIFDLDHFLYFIWTTRPLRVVNIRDRMSKDYQESNPHPYICHSIEFVSTIVIFLFILPNEVWLVLFLGWILHLITDITGYIYIYRSYKPWLKYFILTFYLLKKSKD